MKTNLSNLEKQKDKLIQSGTDYFNSLINQISNKANIVLFGAGDAGKLVKHFLESQGIKIKFFSDNAKEKWGTKIEEILVIPPAELTAMKNPFIIICSWHLEGILLQLQTLGLKNIDTEIYVACLAKKDRDFFANHFKELIEFENILSDKESKQVLYNLILHSLTFNRDLLKKIYDKNQYFFDERFSVNAGDTFIDVGAFTGDTVADIIKRFGKKFKAIHCFEPNTLNYLLLKQYIKKENLEGKVISYNLGLSDKKETLNFSGIGSGFHLTASGEEIAESIQTDTIDELFKDTKVDFIKMDIEGAEPLALQGGAEVIKRDKPKLAICVYHFPNQLWEIPMYIKSLMPEYKLFLRHHTKQKLETVIYAIKQ